MTAKMLLPLLLFRGAVSFCEAELCDPTSGYRYLRISNGGPIRQSNCGDTWALYELIVHDIAGSELSLRLDSVSSHGLMGNKTIDGNLETYWAGDASIGSHGIGAECFTQASVGKQWIILDLGANQPIGNITAVQSSFEPAFSLTKIQFECSRDNSVWTTAVLVDAALLGSTTLFHFTFAILHPDHVAAQSMLKALKAEDEAQDAVTKDLERQIDTFQQAMSRTAQRYFEHAQKRIENIETHIQTREHLCHQKRLLVHTIRNESEMHQHATDEVKHRVDREQHQLDQKLVQLENLTRAIKDHRNQKQVKEQLLTVVETSGQVDTSLEKQWVNESSHIIDDLLKSYEQVKQDSEVARIHFLQSSEDLEAKMQKSRKSRVELELLERQALFCEEAGKKDLQRFQTMKVELNVNKRRLLQVQQIFQDGEGANASALEKCEQELENCHADCDGFAGSASESASSPTAGEDINEIGIGEAELLLDVFYNNFKDLEDVAVQTFVDGVMSGIRRCKKQATVQGERRRVFRSSRRSGPGGPSPDLHCPGNIILRTDKIVNSKSGRTLAQMLRDQCPELVSWEPPVEHLGTGPSWAQVEVAVDDQQLAKQCIMAIGKKMGKRPAVKIVNMFFNSPRD